MTYSKYLPSDKSILLRDRLIAMDDSRFPIISSIEMKDPTTLLLVSIFLGSIGIDRFLLGDIGLGILKLLTFGLFGIWTVIDWFIIQNKTRERNFNELMKYM
jgi:TM2 domain-containing membrane protein YozV